MDIQLIERSARWEQHTCQIYAIVIVVALSFFGWVSSGIADEPILTDQELFSEGKNANDRTDWPRSLKFLYAYLQRNAAVLRDNPGHRAQVEAAIHLAEGAIVSTFEERRRLAQEVSSLTGMPGTIGRELGAALDVPPGLSNSLPGTRPNAILPEYRMPGKVLPFEGLNK